MSKKLDVINLDFDDIKNSLIEFMSDKPEFQDYDFTGSAMNTLIDALVYAVHYTGVYANFSLNESFLDSAILRKSVVSKAKEIGYTPSQTSGALSEFKLTFDYFPISNTSGKVVFPRGTRFLAKTDTGSIPFVMTDDNYFYEDEITPNLYSGIAHVVQGQFITKNWVAAQDTRYIIDQIGVSIKNMIVKVDNLKWTPVETLVKVTPYSNVYFISEIDENTIEIYFGNDVIGKSVQDGSLLDIEYLITSGSDGNYLNQFNLIGDVFLADNDVVKNTNIIISDVVKSYDGSDVETIESIKFLAPLNYQTQNRVVTVDDYKTAVLSNYNNVESINAWGGEDNDPPEYGKVFVSVKPKTGEKVSAIVKTDIETNILQKFGVIGILPEIIDPEYITINLDSIIYYNKDQTILNQNQLITNVNTTIRNYFDESVFEYESSFKYSNLLTDIDESENSIVSNETKVTMGKYFIPLMDGKVTYYINFANEIIENTVESNIWVNTSGSDSKLKDDGLGNIGLYVNDVLFKTHVGDVNYTTGKISLISFDAEIATSGVRVFIFANPVNLNVSVSQNNLIILGSVDVSLSAIEK